MYVCGVEGVYRVDGMCGMKGVCVWVEGLCGVEGVCRWKVCVGCACEMLTTTRRQTYLV